MSETTTAELERQAEIARAQVADTAESIRNKMTPGQLIDEFSGLFTGGDGAAALGNLKSQIRDNPLPLTLIGTGLAWLVLGQGVPSAKDKASVFGAGRNMAEDSSRGTYSGSEAEADTSGAREMALNAAAGVRSAVDSASDSIRHAVVSTSEGVGQHFDAGKRLAGDYADGLASHTSDIAAKARRSATDIFESEPLVLAALGLALGTAIGAMLPSTKLEDDALGEYSEKVKTTAKDLVDKGVEGAKEVAAEAYETVKYAADRQGMTGGDKSIVDKVTDVVRTTAESTEGAIRDRLGSTNDTNRS